MAMPEQRARRAVPAAQAVPRCGTTAGARGRGGRTSGRERPVEAAAAPRAAFDRRRRRHRSGGCTARRRGHGRNDLRATCRGGPRGYGDRGVRRRLTGAGRANRLPAGGTARCGDGAIRRPRHGCDVAGRLGGSAFARRRLRSVAAAGCSDVRLAGSELATACDGSSVDAGSGATSPGAHDGSSRCDRLDRRRARAQRRRGTPVRADRHPVDRDRLAPVSAAPDTAVSPLARSSSRNALAARCGGRRLHRVRPVVAAQQRAVQAAPPRNERLAPAERDPAVDGPPYDTG